MNSKRPLDSNDGWHELFNAVLNNSMSAAEHEQFCNLLRETGEARQLWFLYCDNEIGLSEIGLSENGPSETATRPNAAPPPGARVSWQTSALIFVIAALAFAVLWIAMQETAGDNGGIAASPANDHDNALNERLRVEEEARAVGTAEQPGAKAVTHDSALTEQKAVHESRSHPSESKTSIHESTSHSEETGPKVQESIPMQPSQLSKFPTEQKQRMAAAIAATADKLFAVEKEQLIQLTPIDGARRRIGADSWRRVTALVACNLGLYIINDGQLYHVNPKTGERVELGEPRWMDARSMAVFDDKLYLVSRGRIHQVSPSDGETQSVR